MKHEAAFPSFKAFKSLLCAALAEKGFSIRGDIAVKDVSDELRAQVAVGGNNYFLALTLHIAVPNAAKCLSSEMAKKGIRKRFNSGRAYNPILSADALEFFAADPDLRSAIEQADWPRLCAEAPRLAQLISSAYDDAAAGKLISQSAWWQDRVSDDQLSMLVIAARRMDMPELLGFVEQRYLPRT